ncbi:MAG: hypothetical protein JSW06_08475 [Thermoplasmatales archaeon]|nr:MAG: hypothetical protein JSW06_08475 [Thermoplasmatales archaeon]
MEEKGGSSRLLRRGVSIYYVGSMLFVAGIALVALGSAFIMIFQLHYGSEANQILYTTIFLGTGIILVLIGINMMIKQTKKGYYIIGLSAFISSLAIFIFASNYLHNWYYPIINYVLVLYIMGFLVLLGNAFGNVTLWIIENRPEAMVNEESLAKTYTDEEIQRDINEATRKSVEAAASELQFEVGDTGDIKLGKSSPKTCGLITRVKDDIEESISLKQTIKPGSTEKWGSIGIDKVSMQLAETMNQQKVGKRRFGGFKERILKRFGKQKDN